ncbi:MAG: ribulose-phosphate 3-epimerase [Bacillota bacterium]
MKLQAFAKTPAISPSVISVCDMMRLADSVQALEAAGVLMLHVDLLDGYFSPSLPLGLDAVRALRKATNLALDCHIMAVRNEFFIRELLDIGVEQIVFHMETEPHTDYWLNEIHAAGGRAGVALKPATPLCALEYMLEKCDVVELMLINPGYAGSKGEAQVSYADRKVRELRALIDSCGLSANIELDGRISWENIAAFGQGAAQIFVAGSTCLDKGDLYASAARLVRFANEQGGQNHG